MLKNGQTYFKNLVVFTPQYFYSMFGPFSMLGEKGLNNKINRIHERALKLVHQNNLSFCELLDLDNSVTVQQKKIASSCDRNL